MATFGETSDGTNQSTSSANRVWVSQATPAASGTVSTGHVRLALDSSGSTSIKFAIYADSSGEPGALLAESDALTVNDTTIQWRTLTFSGGNQISVTAGTPYWIGPAWQDPGTPGVTQRWTGSAGGRREQSITTWPTLPNPYGTPTSSTGSGPLSAYVTYTESASSGPTVRSVASAAQDSPTTVVVNKPTGLAVGDYMLAFTSSDADGTLAAMTAPSGFTELGSQAPTIATNIPACKVWGKVADSSDVAASTFSFPDNTGAHCTVVLAAITAGTYSSASPVSTPVWNTQGSAADANITAPSITGSVNALLLAAFLPDTGGTTRTFSSGPAGMTLTHQSAAGASTYTRIGIYQQTLAAAGATGTKTAVLSGTPDGWAATTVQINPAPSNIAARTGGFLQLLQ